MSTREKYESLVKEYDKKKQELLEAKATKTALESRNNEIATELKLYGVDDPSTLDAIIAAEETAINSELADIEAILKGNKAPPVEQKQTKDQPIVGIDELLSLGMNR